MLINANAYRIPLADKSVQCGVTSPPYWGLRDYGLMPLVWGGVRGCAHRWGEEQERDCGRRDGESRALIDGSTRNIPGARGTDSEKASTGQFCQHCSAWRGSLGLEPTPALYVEHLVSVFREVRRVLRDDGTVWLNLGDSYAANRGTGASEFVGAKQASNVGSLLGKLSAPPNLAPKQLIGIPWRVAFALQDDGWFLRSDIIWHKPNCMPESVTDRPTKAHEYLFLLTKKARYYYDGDAVRERSQPSTIARDKYKRTGYQKENREGFVNHLDPKSGEYRDCSAGRNRRSVWTIPTQSYKGAHFATFPEKLVEPCILAGTSARGECPECGLGWVRVTERNRPKEQTKSQKYLTQAQVDRMGGLQSGGTKSTTFAVSAVDMPPVITTGWRPQCPHYPRVDEWQEFPRKDDDESDADYTARMQPIDEIRQALLELWRPLKATPQTVFDPFSGTATVGKVAAQHRRKFVGLELNPEYLTLAEERTTNLAVRLDL